MRCRINIEKLRGKKESRNLRGRFEKNGKIKRLWGGKLGKLKSLRVMRNCENEKL